MCVCPLSSSPQCDYNQQQRQTLYSLAKAEMKRQEVRQQANEVSHHYIVPFYISDTSNGHYTFRLTSVIYDDLSSNSVASFPRMAWERASNNSRLE